MLKLNLNKFLGVFGFPKANVFFRQQVRREANGSFGHPFEREELSDFLEEHILAKL